MIQEDYIKMTNSISKEIATLKKIPKRIGFNI